ncbi:hypothetical protein BC830DRAFT_1108757, partial [Chytriomyces sp. MP71]
IVDILVNKNPVSQISGGSIFGGWLTESYFREFNSSTEIALIANIPRTATVKAVTLCTMYKLSRPKLMKLLTDFDNMRIRVEKFFVTRFEMKILQ